MRLTDLLVEIEGAGDPDFRRFVFVLVLVEEHDAEDWSVGGSPGSDPYFSSSLARRCSRRIVTMVSAGTTSPLPTPGQNPATRSQLRGRMFSGQNGQVRH